MARFSPSDFPDSTFQRLPVTDSVPINDSPRAPSSAPDPFPPKEPSTGHTSQTFTLAQTVLGRFDLMTDGERTDLAELVVCFDDCSSQDRAALLAVARRLAYR